MKTFNQSLTSVTEVIGNNHSSFLTLTAMQRTETLPCQVLILVFCHSCCLQTTFLDQICSCRNLPNIFVTGRGEWTPDSK